MSLNRLIQSPTTIVCATAFTVVAAWLATGYFRAKTVDPRVMLEYSGGSAGQQVTAAQTGIATTMDGEVARTADRIGEATALALSASLCAATEQLNRRTPPSVRDLLAGVSQRGLIPPGLVITGPEGTLVSEHGSLWIRYRPAPLGIEVVSVGNKPENGPALIVRVPDETSDKGEAKLYLAGRLTGVTVPAPFVPAAEVIAMGWSPERLRAFK